MQHDSVTVVLSFDKLIFNRLPQSTFLNGMVLVSVWAHIVINGPGLHLKHSKCFCHPCSAAGPRAETGNEAAGRRSGTGGLRAPLVLAGIATTPLWGAENLRRPSLSENERGRGSGKRGKMRKRKKSYWNPPGSAARILRASTPMTPWTKWYCLYTLS